MAANSSMTNVSVVAFVVATVAVARHNIAIYLLYFLIQYSIRFNYGSLFHLYKKLPHKKKEEKENSYTFYFQL